VFEKVMHPVYLDSLGMPGAAFGRKKLHLADVAFSIRPSCE